MTEVAKKFDQRTQCPLYLLGTARRLTHPGNPPGGHSPGFHLQCLPQQFPTTHFPIPMRTPLPK